jgi:hypothetical protein
MGITVTTNLSLIKPDTFESIKANMPTFAGWAVQNGTNMDKIDALFRADYTTYGMTWTASSVNPTLGAGGFVEGKFLRLHPRMVVVHFRMNVGAAGATAGTGTYLFSLPTGVAPEFALTDGSTPMGKAYFLDSSAVVSASAFLVCYDSVSGKAFLRPSAGDLWTNLLPVALGQNDRVSGYFMYPTADA